MEKFWRRSNNQSDHKSSFKLEYHPIRKLVIVIVTIGLFAFTYGVYSITGLSVVFLFFGFFLSLAILGTIEYYGKYLLIVTEGIVCISPWKKRTFIRWCDIDYISYHEYSNEIWVYSHGMKCEISPYYFTKVPRFAQIVKNEVEEYKYLDAIEKINDLASRCDNRRKWI